MQKAFFGTFLFILISSQGLVRADAPPLIPIQGQLTDAAGVLLEGDVSMVISLYQSQSGGSALYSEVREVQVNNGLFTVYLGREISVDLSLFSQMGEIWLGIQVEDDPEMNRLRLGSVPYSGYAEHTRGPTLAHLSCSTDQIARWNGTGWECANLSPGPTLADLACDIGQVAMWNGTGWECADLVVPQPSLDVVIATWEGDGNLFADGVTVTCPDGYRRVGCGHYCTSGPEDTTSWPVDPDGCSGQESLNLAHGGYCYLHAICARLNN